jgi:hypothetical protein
MTNPIARERYLHDDSCTTALVLRLLKDGGNGKNQRVRNQMLKDGGNEKIIIINNKKRNQRERNRMLKDGGNGKKISKGKELGRGGWSLEAVVPIIIIIIIIWIFVVLILDVRD